MVCWIKRIKRLGLDISIDDNIEKALMKELEVRNHNELEIAIKFLHDETLESIIESNKHIDKIKLIQKIITKYPQKRIYTILEDIPN